MFSSPLEKRKNFDRHRDHCEGIAVVAAEDEAAHEVEEGREDLEPAQAVDRLSLATWTKSEQFGLCVLRITNCRKRASFCKLFPYSLFRAQICHEKSWVEAAELLAQKKTPDPTCATQIRGWRAPANLCWVANEDAG